MLVCSESPEARADEARRPGPELTMNTSAISCYASIPPYSHAVFCLPHTVPSKKKSAKNYRSRRSSVTLKSFLVQLSTNETCQFSRGRKWVNEDRSKLTWTPVVFICSSWATFLSNVSSLLPALSTFERGRKFTQGNLDKATSSCPSLLCLTHALP